MRGSDGGSERRTLLLLILGDRPVDLLALLAQVLNACQAAEARATKAEGVVKASVLLSRRHGGIEQQTPIGAAGDAHLTSSLL